jgi:hypothetical protein
VFARANASPFFVTKITDLQNLRYSRYLDATGTHRLRGPEDVARYSALVTGADPLDFGPHRILTDQQRHMRFRYADELLYAIPSLRGVWYRPRLLHDGSLASLEEMFDRARLSRTTSRRAGIRRGPPHERFAATSSVSRSTPTKAALLAFLRSL